jgi:pimeloyl-ACP methyl ester carboxylesterase
MVTIRRRFADCRFGQLLIREINPGCGTPLLCLHATAYSSLSFLPLLAAYGDRRHVLAVDLPGYGDSDGPTRPVTVADYASAIGEVLPVGAVDVFGYHTGVVVGAELAIAQPERIRALTFMGVPYFRALDFEAWKARLAKPHRLLDGLDQFEERWQWLVTDRPVGMTLKRGFANFVDELKAWPNGFWAHQALFDYDCDASFALVQQPVRILNPDGHLAEASRIAASVFPNAQCVELPELSGAVLEAAAGRLADLIG